MKLLIIEDDIDFSETLVDSLKRDYAVTAVMTGMDGEFLTQDHEYDLIILDLSLPDRNGRTVCKNLRAGGITTPILILTGEKEVNSIVDLLDCGADDYLTKPFRLAELSARIRALLRRKDRKLATQFITVGELKLDTERKIAIRGRKVLHLRRKEYYLLEYLMKNAGKVLSRNMILDNVWEEEPEAASNIVEVHIKYLRDRVDRPFTKKLIKTIHGLGYKIKN